MYGTNDLIEKSVSVMSVQCTCHQIAPGVEPLANQGDCKIDGAKL